MDCGNLYATEGHRVYEAKCEGCQKPIGMGPRGVPNSQRIDAQKNPGKLNTDNDAIKSYLYQLPDNA